MKIRMGFVSNSSSSSYTCDVCNRTESGWDLCLDEAGMAECVNGHTFCEGHAPQWELTLEDRKALLLSGWSFTYETGKNKHLVPVFSVVETVEEYEILLEEHDLVGYDEPEEVPARACPICSFGKVHERDAFLYLLKVAGRDEADLLTELREKFGTYGEMKQWLKE